MSDEREATLVSVESTEKFDNSALAVDCSGEEFGTIEASLYQVLRRTTANRTTENSATNTKAERNSKRAARDCEAILEPRKLG